MKRTINFLLAALVAVTLFAGWERKQFISESGITTWKPYQNASQWGALAPPNAFVPTDVIKVWPIPEPIDWSGTIDLQAEYGLVVGVDKARTLAAAGMNITQAAQKYPRYYARWQAEGRTDAAFLLNGTFTAAFNDAFWRGHAHAINGPPAGSGNIYIGPGEWWHNQQLWWPYGRVIGSGTFGDDRYDTELAVWHEAWNGDVTKRNTLVSPSYGRDGVLGYHESATVEDVRFNGRKTSPYWDTSYESSGIVGWDLGESSEIGRVKSDNYNDFGVHLIRATPAIIFNLSCFTNNRAGVGMTGTALGNVVIILISGDDNPALIEMMAGYGREAGGVLTVLSVKDESATIGEGTLGAMHKWKGQLIAKLRGQFRAVFVNLGHASTWVTSGQLFWIDARLSNGQPQSSTLEAGGKGYGYATAITDSQKHIYIDPPVTYGAWSIQYDCATGECWGGPFAKTPLTGKPFAGTGALGFTRQGETFNLAAGTPQQQVSGTPPPTPPPPTCTWIPGTETCGTCTGTTQTCNTPYVTSVAGCTPAGTKPPDVVRTVTCGTTPPPSGSVIATFNNVNITSQSFTEAVSWANVKSITFTSLKVPTLPGIGYICGSTDRGIGVKGDGSIIDNRGGTNKILKPAGTLVNGVAWSGTVTIDPPWNMSFRGAIPGTGIGLLHQCVKMEIKQ